MVDIHNYGDDIGMQGANRYDPHNVESRYWESNEWVHCDTCPADSGAADTYYLGLGINKPIHFGEGATDGNILDSALDVEVQSNLWGNNYDVSFHNELWATAMMGCNTTLLTWQWEIVHRWDGATLQNLGDPLILSVKDSLDTLIHDVLHDTIKTMYHNYKRLSEFMSYIDFNQTYMPHKYYNEVHDSIECYYMVQSDTTQAYGWVHNMNKYWRNAYYYEDTAHHVFENYFGCERSMQPPDSFRLSGFKANHSYYIQFAPTRLGSQTLPDSVIATTDNLGRLLIDLSTAPLGCDSTNADYAFTVGSSFIRRLMNPNKQPPPPPFFDFNIFPNPCHSIFNMTLPLNGSLKSALIEISDPIGKTIFKEIVNDNRLTLDLSDKQKGIYYVRLTIDNAVKVKRIIVL